MVSLFVCLFVLETGSHYRAQANLKLVIILLFQPAKCWYYKLVAPNLVQRALPLLKGRLERLVAEQTIQAGDSVGTGSRVLPAPS